MKALVLVPFRVGPANQKSFSLKTNSGIWIFSKHRIERSHSIVFKTRFGIDAFSRKGALLAEIKIDNQPIQIVGTHLQNAGGDWRRYSQCVELYNRLLLKYERISVPQIVCGDFNINKNKSVESYQYMLQVLDVSDGTHTGTNNFSYDILNNDLVTEFGESQDLIDYVLVRQPDHSAGERRIRVLQHPWAARHRDLSDHFAVEAEIPLMGPPRTVATIGAKK